MLDDSADTISNPTTSRFSLSFPFPVPPAHPQPALALFLLASLRPLASPPPGSVIFICPRVLSSLPLSSVERRCTAYLPGRSVLRTTGLIGNRECDEDRGSGKYRD